MTNRSKILNYSFNLHPSKSFKRKEQLITKISCSTNNKHYHQKEKNNDKYSKNKRFEMAIATCVAAATLNLLNPSIADAEKLNLFEPMRYLGRWYEVASLKSGFAGQGQDDCHCTQGVYLPKKTENDDIALEVNTFCFHGGPQGRLSGIQGFVTCADPYPLALAPEFKTKFENEENIVEKCSLKFPAIPIIPPETYNIIRTDYDNYALVQGAPDTTFVQIYSRVPNPGKKFIEEQKAFLKKLSYPVELIKETPQDCPDIKMEALMGMMENPRNEPIMTNTLQSPFANVTSPKFGGNRNPIKLLKDFFKINVDVFNN